MKKYAYRFTAKAKRQFLKLPSEIRRRALSKLKMCILSSNPFVFIFKLKGYENLYKLRIGDYRLIVFPKCGEEMLILLVTKAGHRKDVYKSSLYEDVS